MHIEYACLNLHSCLHTDSRGCKMIILEFSREARSVHKNV